MLLAEGTMCVHVGVCKYASFLDNFSLTLFVFCFFKLQQVFLLHSSSSSTENHSR